MGKKLQEPLCEGLDVTLTELAVLSLVEQNMGCSGFDIFDWLGFKDVSKAHQVLRRIRKKKRIRFRSIKRHGVTWNNLYLTEEGKEVLREACQVHSQILLPSFQRFSSIAEAG